MTQYTQMNNLTAAWARYTDLVAVRANGHYLYTADGRTLLDFSSGIGVTNTGHCHPRITAAAKDQIDRMIHGQINIVYHEPVFHLIDELLTVVPPGLDTFFFGNSGAESVEAAIKLARQATGRPNIISFRGAFHGRSMGALSVTTSSSKYRAGYQPLVGGIYVAPYPYAFHYKWTAEETAQFCLEEIQRMLLCECPPQDTAAFLIEPVLGEGGYVPSPPGFLAGLREICNQHGILLIADEVQSGFGRTGRWFACEHYNTIPDILTMAKGIASGFPLSGIAAPKKIMDAWLPGSHGGTFGANAVSCAAAAATIQVIREEKLVENSSRMGAYLIGRLQEIQSNTPIIGDVRGLGLMIATEFSQADGSPNPEATKAVWSRCLEKDLLLLTCGTYHNVIRWIPPLTIEQSDIDHALDIFQSALQDATS